MCTCLPPYLTSYAGWLERGSQWHCLYLHKFPALLPISAAAILLRDKHLLSEQKGKKRRFLLMISSDKLMTDKIQDHLEHMCISSSVSSFHEALKLLSERNWNIWAAIIMMQTAMTRKRLLLDLKKGESCQKAFCSIIVFEIHPQKSHFFPNASK